MKVTRILWYNWVSSGITPYHQKFIGWVIVVCTFLPSCSAGMDTMRTNIRNGGFEIGQVKPGTYKLVIEAIAPYKNFQKEGVVVNEKKATDVGEITLQQ